LPRPSAGNFLDVPLEEFDRTLPINLRGAVLGHRPFGGAQLEHAMFSFATFEMPIAFLDRMYFGGECEVQSRP
jgi:hypothetical protein